jgi:RNA polymerase sigma factor (sigma-70 family)
MIPASTKTPMPSSDLSRRRTRVVIVEDNQAVADSLRHLLDLRGCEVRVADTGPEGVRLAQEWLPEVVLCDIGLPGLDEEDLVQRLGLMGDIFNYALARKQAYEALERANQQVRSLRKQLASVNQQLQAAVRQVLEQKSLELARQQEASRVTQLLDSLKPREHKVFLLVAAGLANKQIAARLGLSLQTVKFHRGRLMRKLQLHSVTELARLAEKARLPLPSL